MGTLIFWLVLFFPLAEVFVLAKVGSRIGFWDTTFLLIFSAFFGAYLAKLQGKIALQRIQACLAEGRMPSHEMVDGLLLLIGGLLFVFPGFISDILGLFLIFPPTRFLVRLAVLGNMKTNLRAWSPNIKEKGAVRPEGKIPMDRKGAEDAQIVE